MYREDNMKVILCFCFTLIIDSCITQYQQEHDNPATQEKRAVLKRISRAAIADLRQQFQMRLETIVISNCKANRKVEEANNLQNLYDEMKECMGKGKIFFTPKDEYFTYITECSKESIAKTKECLADNQQYFPEFILNVTKSFVEFLYDDTGVIDMRACIPKLYTDNAPTTYIQCLYDVAIETNDSIIIPPSKDEYCKRFLPTHFCFTNLIKERCDRTANIREFREDYIAASRRPCNT